MISLKLNLSDMVMMLSYFIFVFGVWLVFSTSIQSFIVRLSFLLRGYKHEEKSVEIAFVKHIETLLLTVFGENARRLAYTFLFISFLIGLVIWVVVSRQLGFMQGILLSMVFMGCPYLFLRVKLYTLRIESSYEGEFLISELINQYKLNHFNMVEAIEATVKCLKNSPRTQRLLFSMSIHLKSYKTKEELELILNEFSYAVDTQWSKMLINNFVLSIEEGFVVTSGLTDIQQELQRAKSAYEKSDRNTIEGFAIVKFLIPILYVFTIYLSIKYFNFTLEKFIQYQLFTETGQKLFAINAVLFIANFILMIVFKKRKFDIT